MRLLRTFGPAAALLLAAGLHAQTTEPTNPSSPGPTTGGTAPPPTSPTTGGTAPSRPLLIFPTDPAATARAAASTGTVSVFPTQTFQVAGVPAALNLTDRQRTQLDTATQQLQARFQPQFDRVNALPATDRQAQLDQLNRDYTAAWLDAARGVFTADQLARYQQLQLQSGGLAALNDPVAQRALNLTDAQLNQLKQDIAWSAQQQAAIQQAALTDQARALQLSSAFNTAAQTRLNQLLTPAQQQSWSQITGTPFAFPPVFPAGTGTATVTGATGFPFVPGMGTTGPTAAPGTGTTGTGGLVMPGTTTGSSGLVMPGTTVPGRTGVGGAPIQTGTPGTTGTGTGVAPGTITIPGRTGVGGAPIGPTRPAPPLPGAPGPTTGGAAPPPLGPTTGGPAPTPGPTTGGPAPTPGPTTGGPTPGGPGNPGPPRM